MTSPTRQHPSVARLQAFGLGLLEAQETEAIEQHIRTCDVCCGKLLEVPDDGLVLRLRQAAAQEAAPPGGDTGAGLLSLCCPNPGCGKSAQVPTGYRGRSIRCGRCGHRFRVPDADATPLPAAAAPDRRGTSRVAWTVPPAECPPRIARFVIRAHLGAGGFGDVYRAHDPQLDRDVALKVPRPGVLNTPARVERFLREARAAARLSHPRIVPVHEAGQDGGLYYIASAFIPGRTLADALRDGPFDGRRAARVVAEVADALAYAHALGIVHRDVKPANVLLDEQDQPHLADFGLAHRRELAGQLTQDGAIVGTPAYMAPEHARGSAAEAQPASDQYSLGVVLYELLTGRPPFAGDPAALLFHALHTEPPPPRRLNSQVPADLETVCLKALAKEPAARYAGCRELAEDLRRWLEGEPVKARPPGPAERCLRWWRREWKLAAAAAAVAACLLLVAGVAAEAAHLVALAHQARADAEDAGRQKQADLDGERRRLDTYERLVHDARAALDGGQYDKAAEAAEEAAAVPGIGDERGGEAKALADRARQAGVAHALADKDMQRLWDDYQQALADGRQALAKDDFDAAARAFGLARTFEPRLVVRDRLKLEDCAAGQRLLEVERARAARQAGQAPRAEDLPPRPRDDADLDGLRDDYRQALADARAARKGGHLTEARALFQRAGKMEGRLVAAKKLDAGAAAVDQELKDLAREIEGRCDDLVNAGLGCFGTLRFPEALDKARAALKVDPENRGALDLFKRASERLWLIALGHQDFPGAHRIAGQATTRLPDDPDPEKWQATTDRLAEREAQRLAAIRDEEERRQALVRALADAQAAEFQGLMQEALLEDSFQATVADATRFPDDRARLKGVARRLWPLAVGARELLCAQFVVKVLLEVDPDDEDALKWQQVNAAVLALEVAVLENALEYRKAVEAALARHNALAFRAAVLQAAQQPFHMTPSYRLGGVVTTPAHPVDNRGGRGRGEAGGPGPGKVSAAPPPPARPTGGGNEPAKEPPRPPVPTTRPKEEPRPAAPPARPKEEPPSRPTAPPSKPREEPPARTPPGPQPGRDKTRDGKSDPPAHGKDNTAPDRKPGSTKN
jgi:hypothetical protein